MNKFIFLASLFLIISCSQDNNSSIKLGVDQKIKIPVQSVSVLANVQLEKADASEAEENGYKKLSKAVKLLKKRGYKKDNLQINSGEIRNRSFQQEQAYLYNSSIGFDINDLNKIDPIRHALLQQGVNSFTITSYKNPKEDSLYDRAYRQAIQKAKQKAQGLLANQQVEIGKILNLSENIEETVGLTTTKQSKRLADINLDANMEQEPLFNKRYYDKSIEFTIEFALN